MKSHRVVLALALFLLPSVVPAQAITYSGRLTDGTGWGQSTQVQMVVRLYGSEEGVSPVWESPPITVSVVDGYFSVVLSEGHDASGATLGIEQAFADNPKTFLAIVVNGDELAPRQLVGSVPYAFECAHLGGQGPERYVWNQTATWQNGGMKVAGDGYFKGRVGVGTDQPGAGLHVAFSSNSEPAALFTNAGGSGIGLKIKAGHYTSSTPIFEAMTNDGLPRLVVTANGLVGIGTSDPQKPLHVAGGASIGGMQIDGSIIILKGKYDGSNRIVFIDTTPGGYGHQWELYPTSNSFDIFDRTRSATPFYITNDGNASFEKNINVGGKCTASSQGNCDIAEAFLSLDNAGPGDVVSLDPSRFKAMRLADRPYDPMLAGVVSTEPTLLMGQNDVPEGVAIALAGVIPVKVTLENGPIAVGDLLTSSSTPGHAMRADRPGPVIGKAMEPFDGGQGWTGTIRMLVVPQTCSGTADMAARVEALEATVRVLTERLDRLSRRCGSGEGEAE